MWVWDADPLFSDTGRREFLEFCVQQGIATAWIQVGALPGARLRQAADWQRLLAEAHRVGIAIHALDGAPEFVLPHRHADVMNLVEAVIAFNREAPADARFAGIHLDNEPYLLPGWHEPAARERLLGQFLDLNARIRDAVTRAGRMEFGVDIPFWWQARDAETGEAIGAVTFRGQRKAASYHLLDLVDNVGIMDYRNVAEGRDGLIAHARDLLLYADGARARIFVGVEISRSEDAPYWFVTGVPRRTFRRAVGRSALLDARDLTIIDDGEQVLVGVRATGEASDEARLVALARLLSATVLNASGRRALDSARAVLANEGEWKMLSPAPVIDHDGRAYGGLRTSRVMLAKLTFAGRSGTDMARELAIAEAAFRQYKSYVGIAVHHYESFKARFETAPSDQRDSNR